MDVAILMTAHDRREETLSCLMDCHREADAMKAGGEYRFTIYLLDDGSTDGTAEAVSERFPDVKLTRSDGNLFWNRGMEEIWKTASREHDYDFYLWIKSRAKVCEGAFTSLLENSSFLRHKAIVAGTAADRNGNLTYGGRTRYNRIIPPDPTIPVPCHTFDGCLVLVPSSVYGQLGNLDHIYRHRYGDRDYGVRAYKKDITRVVCPGILCTCEKTHMVPLWRDSAYSLRQRYRLINSISGRPFREQFVYDCRSMGFFRAVIHFVTLNLSVLFPVNTNRKLS